MYGTLYTVNSVPYTVYCVKKTTTQLPVYMPFSLSTVHSTQSTVYRTLFTVHGTLYTVHNLITFKTSVRLAKAKASLRPSPQKGILNYESIQLHILKKCVW